MGIKHKYCQGNKSHRNNLGIRICKTIFFSSLVQMIRAQMMHISHIFSYLLSLIRLICLYWEFESGNALEIQPALKLKAAKLNTSLLYIMLILKAYSSACDFGFYNLMLRSGPLYCLVCTLVAFQMVLYAVQNTPMISFCSVIKVM